MALQQLQRIVALSSLLLATASAFSATSTCRSPSVATSASTALNAATAWMDDDEPRDLFLMSSAAACASSESCSLEEAQSYLDDILMTQIDCLDVAVASRSSALCENVDAVTEVVANLRVKIELERRRLNPVKIAVNAANLALGVYVISTIMHGVAVVPNVPVDAPMFTSFDTFSDAAAINSRGVASILPQEWFWAIRDGYFPSLFSEWSHNGGLVVDTSMFDQKVVAFTPQEWVWLIQNGSIGNLLQENMRYGGYVVDSGFDTEGLSPMTSKDVFASIQGGYLGDAMKHFYRNGGV